MIYWCRRYFTSLHNEGVKQTEDAELIGIWNRTREKAVSKSKLFGCKVFDTVEELINSVDVVYILTNMETHHQYARQAIDVGKHVLIEKPTAVTVEEIEDLKMECRQNECSCDLCTIIFMNHPLLVQRIQLKVGKFEIWCHFTHSLQHSSS